MPERSRGWTRKKKVTTWKSQFKRVSVLFFGTLLLAELLRIFCQSESRKGVSAAAARHCAHVLGPHGYQTDKQALPEVSKVSMHPVSKQGATLHGRGKHGEAEQARCHGQRNLLDELWTVKSAMRVRVLLLFALAGTDFRPVGSGKTLCTYHLHCTRRCAALCVKARRWGATERAALGSNWTRAKSSKKNVFGEAHANNLGLKTKYD